MTRARWIILAAVLLVALFAVVIGGFLWPRPQWDKGPWQSGDETPVEAPPAPPG